jgi:hypothetical protein
MTQSGLMARIWRRRVSGMIRSIARYPGRRSVVPHLFCLLMVLIGPLLKAQATDDPVTVSTEHPRLFLRPQRLRLLKRERQRSSPVVPPVAAV